MDRNFVSRKKNPLNNNIKKKNCARSQQPPQPYDESDHMNFIFPKKIQVSLIQQKDLFQTLSFAQHFLML